MEKVVPFGSDLYCRRLGSPDHAHQRSTGNVCPVFKSAFTPKMDDELAFLLAKAHHNLGQLEGLIQYAPNRIPFCDLMVLKECTNFCYPSIIIFIISSIADD